MKIINPSTESLFIAKYSAPEPLWFWLPKTLPVMYGLSQ